MSLAMQKSGVLALIVLLIAVPALAGCAKKTDTGSTAPTGSTSGTMPTSSTSATPPSSSTKPTTPTSSTSSSTPPVTKPSPVNTTKTLSIQGGPVDPTAVKASFDIPATGWATFTVACSANPPGGLPNGALVTPDGVVITLKDGAKAKQGTTTFSAGPLPSGDQKMSPTAGAAGTWTLDASSQGSSPADIVCKISVVW